MAGSEHYRRIIHEFCDLAGLQEPLRLIEDGRLCIDGVDLLLVYDEAFDPRRLQLRMDLQALPRSHKHPTAMLTALLVNNYISGIGGLFVFGLNPRDNHVVLTVQVMLDDEATGRELLTSLKDAVAQAKTVWQQLCDEIAKGDRSTASSRMIRA